MLSKERKRFLVETRKKLEKELLGEKSLKGRLLSEQRASKVDELQPKKPKVKKLSKDGMVRAAVIKLTNEAYLWRRLAPYYLTKSEFEYLKRKSQLSRSIVERKLSSLDV